MHRTLTESYALFNSQVQPKHTKVCLQGLYETEALRLLCTHAFKCQEPEEGYQEIVKKLVRYCDGHPLALKVLGGSLHNTDVANWEACIKRLKKGLDSNIQKALHMSFKLLPSENDKELFKHIACFFVEADRNVTETILRACDIETGLGIKILIDRSLLSIGWNNKLMMHQLIQELGRDLGKGNILGLALDMKMLENMLHGSSRSDELKTDSLSQMHDLILLQLNYVQMDGSYENFPEELRWLCMHGFPLKSIPPDLPMENLVALDLSYSNIESFGMCYSNSQPLNSRRKFHRSLKILDLSFCEHLHSLSGFLESPELERLIVRNCTSLLEVCESIGQCIKLVFIDMSFCYKLRKLPRSMRKLKTVKTLMLDGCTSLESRIQIGDTDSLEILVASTGLNSQTSSSTIMEDVPSVLKYVAIYLPCSLLTLSLRSSNLSTESFPNDLSSLSKLKNLYLDHNPISSMPNCVRSLSSLEKLTMYGCNMLTSIVHPPCTLRVMLFGTFALSTCSLQKIIFDPEMAPLEYHGDTMCNLPHSSLVIDGMVKIQPMTGVEEKVFRSLGWKNLDFLKKRRVWTYFGVGREEGSQTQMYYEFGIFSTIYGGEHMPKWIKRRNKGSSISFTIPSSPKKLRGLNFFYVETLPYKDGYHKLPMIKISNITRGHIWIYTHFMSRPVRVDGKCFIYLSHWMFGINEMESGDHITITVIQDRNTSYRLETSNCGVRIVYDDEKMEEEGDVLGCYKSWNHIIGGDLSSFQTTTGEYLLSFDAFRRYDSEIDFEYLHLFDANTRYKDPSVAFKAFSPRR